MLVKKDIPDFLVSGERARLIPVVSEGSKEGRATSILLASLYAVNEFAQNVFGAVGVRIGTRTRIDVFTEVVFADKEGGTKLRPDGLVIIDTGRGQWKAIIEAKIGTAELNPEQVKEYIAIAKKNNIDAVITISNQYSALPTHHPVALKKSETKGVELYHWSWMFILTEAILLLKSIGVEDVDQRFILSEMVRYFDHDKVGVSSFGQMNAEWKDVTGKVKNGAELSKNSTEVENTIGSWHQEARDLCLIMSRKLAVPVSSRLSRKHKSSPIDRIKDDCDLLVSEKKLLCELDVPDAASTLTVSADLMRRTIGCSMRVQAPKDKQRATAKLNWLLRQLKDIVDVGDVYIKVLAQGRSSNLQESLARVRENPNSILMSEGTEIQPLGFDVVMIRDIAGKFSGRTTFIEELESLVTDFYERVGQNLKAWVPDAPKVKKEDSEDPIVASLQEDQEVERQEADAQFQQAPPLQEPFVAEEESEPLSQDDEVAAYDKNVGEA